MNQIMSLSMQTIHLDIFLSVSPYYFAGEKTINTLGSILRQDYGADAIMQFILFADTNIDKHCEDIKRGDTRQTPLTSKMSKYHADFLNDPHAYDEKIKENKLKNFRLFVCLKTPVSFNKSTIKAFEEGLNGAGLSPRHINASELLSLLRQLLNNSKCNSKHYDGDTPIAKQIIQADTVIDFSDKDYIKVGDKFIGVITPKEFPEMLNEQELSANQVNELAGSYQGGINDLAQITSRFLWSCNILLDKVDSEIKLKSAFASAQRMGAKQTNNISDRISMLSNASKRIHSDYYLKFIPTLVLFADTEEGLSITTTKAIRLWESQGFLMQHENHIKHILFLSSLPFGLITGKKNSNIGLIDRHFIAPAKAVANQLPVQADFFGFGSPIVPFIGRKGQVQGLDLYSKGANNHNLLCSATSGSGKSFVINWIIAHYYANKTKIRLIDIGGSYKKICHTLGGEYLDVADKENNINFNPFQIDINLNKTYTSKSDKKYDESDKKHDINSIATVISAMICSTDDDAKLSPEEYGLVMHAVKEAVSRGIVENGIDFIQSYLTDPYKYSSKDQIPVSLEKRSKVLAFNLCEFSSKGQYGKYFNNVTENTWKDNDFVVLELEGLAKKPPLLKVVMLQVITMMTMEMYQGDKTIKKMLILEELSTLLKLIKSNFIANIVEDAYRRARKYNGSIGSIFQSIRDTKKFGDVGDVMLENSAFKFFLESAVYDKAIEEKIINYDGIAKELLINIKSNRPHYSEIFMDTPGGIGVSRLMVGPYGYAVATTDANEVAEIESYQKNGMSIDEAFEEFASKRGLKKA
ncbi:MAG: hypothetical protein Rsou_0338 [Candidatus Ruthia sp. Asou_11_S2]|nr:hypothetical protein [Candidatus Ruthia sp. Asou_11_S2]